MSVCICNMHTCAFLNETEIVINDKQSQSVETNHREPIN